MSSIGRLDIGSVTRSIPDVIYERIKQGILSGLYPPGTVLRQDHTATSIGASRVPVREAFSRLEAEGFLTIRPRRGYAVPSLDVSEIMEIFDLRMIVEEHAGRVAALARTRADVTVVEELGARMERLDPAEADYLNTWCELNRQFHQRIVETAGRHHLAKIALQLRDLVEPYIRIESAMTGHFDQAHMDHRSLSEAFAQGDGDLLARLSRDHCMRTADRLLRALRKKPGKFGVVPEATGVRPARAARAK